MKRIIKHIGILAAIISLPGMVSGQYSQTQYFMNIPQSNIINPAFRPSSKVFIALPALSNTYIGINNNLLTVSEFFQPVPGTDSVMTLLHPDYDREAFLNSLGKTGYISAEVSTQLFGVGFSINNDWWVELGLSEKGMVSGYIPRDLFSLLLDGNEQFVGSSIDLSGFGARAFEYLESSLSISKNISSRLRVGGRAKLLFGGAGTSLEANLLKIDVNEDFSHTLHTDLRWNVSGPVDVYTNSDHMVDSLSFREGISPFDVLLNPGNTGFAFDAGAQYNLTDQITLTASLVDFGFISWKKEAFSLSANNNFSFDGFDLSGVIAGDMTFDDMLSQFTDSLKNSFIFEEGTGKFTMGIPAKLFIGASYRPVKYFSAGILSRSTFNQGHMNQALSLSASLYAGNAFTTTLTYTMANRSYSNLGLGMAVKLGAVQLYLISDQLPLSWVKFTNNEGGFSGIAPNRIDYLNFRFGFNLVFGKMKDNKTDAPMIIEEQ